MARFASKFLNYKHGIRNGRWVVEDGLQREVTREILAEFKPNILTEPEIQQAIVGMTHRGRPVDRNTEELFSPRHRISGLDTELMQAELQLTDEERELVEKRLRESQHFGQDHIELIPEPAVIPWANYDELGIEQILVVIDAIKVPVEDVIAYELEHQNREELLELLRAQPALAADPGPVIQA